MYICDIVKPADRTRRDFLGQACAAAACASCALAALPVSDYLVPRPDRALSGPVTVAKVDDIPEGSAKVVRVGAAAVLLVRHAGQLRAMSAECTHLSCIVEWDSRQSKIVCNCHGGLFEPDGRKISGPPKSDLAPLPVRVVGDRIILGT